MMMTAPEEIFSTLLDDPDLVELVELFVGELPDRTAQLAKAMQSGDMAEVGRYAHQLKGAAGSYGFECVTPYAAKLERAARSGEPEDRVQSALDELRAICARLRATAPTI
jgi:HPt (histidine-containing phosphotransfer) domain-containing protein